MTNYSILQAESEFGESINFVLRPFSWHGFSPAEKRKHPARPASPEMS